jgi:hypothetical protein
MTLADAALSEALTCFETWEAFRATRSAHRFQRCAISETVRSTTPLARVFSDAPIGTSSIDHARSSRDAQGMFRWSGSRFAAHIRIGSPRIAVASTCHASMRRSTHAPASSYIRGASNGVRTSQRDSADSQAASFACSSAIAASLAACESGASRCAWSFQCHSASARAHVIMSPRARFPTSAGVRRPSTLAGRGVRVGASDLTSPAAPR